MCHITPSEAIGYVANVRMEVSSSIMTIQFPGKSKPSDTKTRGGYYTPKPIARFVARWVSETGPHTLEPAAGDGALLDELALLGSPTAVELVPEEAEKAQQSSGVEVHVGDFFHWFTDSMHESFDGVAGNPPYIRFGNWEEEYRSVAFDYMKNLGLNPTRLTNAWLPFVIASVMATRRGGRIGLVLPAELLQVDYAKQVRSFLIDHCSDITIISFSQLVFPGILQEVVLLLAVRGEGPALMRGIEVQTAADLDEVQLDTIAIQAPLHESEKWTKYYLQPEQIELLRRFKSDDRLSQFGDFAAVNVGVVTGRNSFFCMTEAKAAERGLSDLTIGLLSRSASLISTTFTSEDLKNADAKGLNSRLLAVEKTYDPSQNDALEAYIDMGESEEVHLGYKCSIRTPWWSVPSIQVPDGFMLRQVSKNLRVASNHAQATSTDTVHRVFRQPGVNMDKLAVATLNSITLAYSETMGRSYGGGLLEMEPGEAIRLPIPDPDLVPNQLIEEIDTLLREGLEQNAIDLVDETVLIRILRITKEEIEMMQKAHHRLLSRRLGRGK